MRAALRIFLALALLVSWQVALEHPVVHVDVLGELVHVPDGDSHRDSGPLCDTLAALTACAPQHGAPVVDGRAAASAVPPFPRSAPRAAEAPPFLAQGPPASV